ncbi:MAG: hypothetical protein Q7U92_23625, partial [Bradyrhizobium sp.]|nr:hypothetical protein [Bradyrhizobium sp.]
MTWRVWVVLVVVFALGFGRLLIEKKPDKAIDVAAARSIAEKCLGSARNIVANTNVTLVPVATLNQASALALRTTSTMELDAGLPDTAPTKNVTVSKDKGEFEFELSGGPAILKIGEDEFYIDTTRKPRFGALPNLRYPITLDHEPKTKVVNGKQIATLPPGTTGTVQIGAGLDLVTVQPVPARSWLNGVKPTLLPVRAIGQQGLSDLSIDVKQGGIRFDEQGFMLDGCAWRSSGDPTQSNPVGIAEVKA